MLAPTRLQKTMRIRLYQLLCFPRFVRKYANTYGAIRIPSVRVHVLGEVLKIYY